MATFVLTDAQQVTLAVAGADAAGALRPIFGAVLWTSSDLSALRVVPAVDGLTALAISVAAQPEGASPVVVTASAYADAALTTPIFGTLNISVIATPATQLIITPGAPEPKLAV